MLLEGGRFLRGHVFMGRRGGDAKEIANILIILTEVVFTQHLPLSVSCYYWTQNKDLLGPALNPGGDSYVVVSKTIPASCCSDAVGLKRHTAPERSYPALPQSR